MYEIKLGLVVTMLVLTGSGIGGLFIQLFQIRLKSRWQYLNGLCGGMLVGLLGLEMYPELFSHHELLGVFSGVSLGVILMMVMDKMLHHHNQPSELKKGSILLLFIAFALHSIPTGMAVGINLQGLDSLHISILGALLIHHIPEGMILMLGVLSSQMQTFIFWLLCLALSFIVGANAIASTVLFTESYRFNTLTMGAAVGTLTYIAVCELFLKGYVPGKRKGSLCVFITGALLIGIFLWFVPPHL